MNESKSLFKTRTFWLNVIGTGVLVLSGQIPGVHVPPNIATGGMAILNVINRLFTNSPAHIIE